MRKFTFPSKGEFSEQGLAFNIWKGRGMTGSLSIVVCIDIDPPIKPMEQREEIKKEKNTAAISNRNALKSLSQSLYLSIHPMNCVKCVRPKAYLYNLVRNETIRRVVSFFPTDEIRSTIFRPK